MMTISKKIFCIIAILSPYNTANSIEQVITANIAFESPDAVANLTDADFGSLSADVGPTTYTIDTAGNIYVESGPGVVIEASSASAESFKITGDGLQSVTATSGDYTASEGVTPSKAVCKYNKGASHGCDGMVAYSPPTQNGADLAIGLSITTKGGEISGTKATPALVITISYS